MTNEKIRLNLIMNLGGIFVPSIFDLQKRLGHPHNLSTMFHFAQKKMQIKLPVGERTLRKPEISLGTAKKIFQPFVPDKIEFGILRKISLVGKIFSNAPGTWILWESALIGFEQRQPLYSKTVFVIRERCKADKECIYKVRNAASDLEKKDIIISTLKKYTWVDPTLIEEGATSMLDYIENGKLTSRVLEFVVAMYVDFYFMLFSSFEAECVELAQQKQYSFIRIGFLADLMPIERKDIMIGPMERLFDYWQKILSEEKGSKVSWTDMAQAMPAPTKSSRKLNQKASTLQKSNYRMLCQWRKAKHIPSDGKLRLFIANLHLPNDDEIWFWQAKIAMFLNSIYKEPEIQMAHKTFLLKTFAQYSTYSEKTLARFADPEFHSARQKKDLYHDEVSQPIKTSSLYLNYKIIQKIKLNTNTLTNGISE